MPDRRLPDYAALRARLAAFRRELVASLDRDFDTGGVLPQLACLQSAIDAIDAVGAESVNVAPAPPATFGRISP
jgi:hypothetical protein